MATKNDYLAYEEVKGLTKYITALIDGEKFEHSYVINNSGRNKAWIAYNNNNLDWSCATLQEARDKYFWMGDFNKNKENLDRLSESLIEAVNSGDEKEALCACMSVLSWGSVNNGAYSVSKAYCEDRLISSINEALEALTPDDDVEVNLDGFDGSTLIMNASYTKFYSLLSKEKPFIIYDSRVAAALSLIVKSYWLQNRKNNEALPEYLCLSCLEARSKSARCANNKIENIKFRMARNDSDHALWNVRANWIIETALSNSSKSHAGSIQDVRDVEAALFMIGYSL